MSMTQRINDVLGFRLFPSSEERRYERQAWRKTVHAHNNEVAKAVGMARRSKAISADALNSLRDTVEAQATDRLRDIEIAFIEKLRGQG